MEDRSKCRQAVISLLIFRHWYEHFFILDSELNTPKSSLKRGQEHSPIERLPSSKQLLLTDFTRQQDNVSSITQAVSSISMGSEQNDGSLVTKELFLKTMETMSLSMTKTMQQSLAPLTKLVGETVDRVAKTEERVDAHSNRLEMLERNMRSTSACIWNFPLKEYDLNPRSSDRSVKVRNFLKDVLKISAEDAHLIGFRAINIMPFKDSDVGMVRIDFTELDGKSMCWSKARNLQEYNKSRPADKRVVFRDDLTEEQRETRKRQRSMDFDDSGAGTTSQAGSQSGGGGGVKRGGGPRGGGQRGRRRY